MRIMDVKTFDKSKSPNRHVADGAARAPHRLLSHAISLPEEAISSRQNNLENVKLNRNQRVVSLVSTPISQLGGVAGLKGSHAPEGAIVKVASMKVLQFHGPARCCDREADAFAVVNRGAREVSVRSTLFATPKSKVKRVLAAVVIAMAAGTALVPAAFGRDVTYTSPRAAFEQGLGAFRTGYYEIAVPALEHAITAGDADMRFFAAYYLARVYSDNAGTQTDHSKAYMLFKGIALEHGDTEPENVQRVPLVARSLTTLAGYVLRGIPEISLKPDAAHAVDYLRHAATFFNDKDAQFELAKLLLLGDGVPQDLPTARHYLSTLSEGGHVGAQAFLADLHWRGKSVPKDERRALALIKMAVENAPAEERVWIEDIYQNIYCGTSRDVREQSKGLVAAWKRLFAQRPSEPGERQRMALGASTTRDIGPFRTCANGEPVDINRGGAGADTGTSKPVDSIRPSGGPANGLIDAGEKPRTR
jgi:uncharacterized protein